LFYPWINPIGISPEKLYPQLCCINYLLIALDQNNAFSESLKQLIRKHPNIDIKAMGFSEVWMKEALWSEKRI